MRALQRLVRNGNANSITIPRAMLVYLGWITGEDFMVLVNEDHSVTIRRPALEDFQSLGKARVLPATAAELHK